MRYKDIKQHNITYNINKICNILTKCNCIFVCLTGKDLKKLVNGQKCEYVMFNDNVYKSTYIIKYELLTVNNVLKLLNN